MIYPANLWVYLSTWLKTATDGNVWAERRRGTSGEWIVFRCRCGDNLHQGVESFDDSGTKIPSAVQMWVGKHVHDRKAEKERRELEMLIEAAREKYDVSTLKAMLTDPRPVAPVEMPTGRKFRRLPPNAEI